jgi:ATP-dependent protease ClpP protease subunit
MPSWHELLEEIKVKGSTFDVVRRDYLRRLYRKTGRNVIVYYSGWLQKQGINGVQVNDADKNGLMTVIHGLDRSKGLDLILHTPGGETAATESIVDYLHSMFGRNMRAIVPQLAMSAGTMIACACQEIIMGKQSSLGPIDPQFGPLPAHGVVEEFKRAYKEIKSDPAKIPLWQPIIAKYYPTLIGECEKAIQWSNDMVKDWLLRGMLNPLFQQDPAQAKKRVNEIVKELSDHALTKSHARHLSAEKCKSIGLNVTSMEDDQKLQDLILTIHHACIHTLSATLAFKIIENHNGVAFIQISQPVFVPKGGNFDNPSGLELP